ncbi:MAG TPA: sodium/proline symporter [Flavobacteriales bacterium]|nr:sodium/proline symporter [Flavobacteriales bacterium]
MSLNVIVLLFYFGILLAIGVFASRKVKGLADFYVGGKDLGYWVVAFSTRATGESAWLLLGLTGMGALIGISAFWVVAGELLGVATAWFFMAKPFKEQTDKYNSITIPDYLVSRLQPKTNTLRMVAASTLAIFVTIYVSAQIDATGSAFETFLGWNYYHGILLGFGAVVLYIFIGGFVAVAWSDLFQGLLMLFGLVGLPIVAWYSVNNSTEITDGLMKISPDLLSIWGSGGFSLHNIFGILGLMLIGIGFLGSPQLFVRFIAVRNTEEIEKGKWVALFFTLLTDSSAVLIGLLGRFMFTEAGDAADQILGNGAQNVLPMLVEHVMPAFIAAIYVAVVLSAIMSTIDSLLVVASSAITRDFYQQIFNPELKDNELAGISRYVTLGLAIVSLLIALAVSYFSPTRTIFWFVIFGWSGIAATFCPVIILSLFWKNYNISGALASMISGFLCVPIFKFLGPEFPVVGPYLNQLNELPPSFTVAILVGIFVSLVTRPKSSGNG